MGEILIALIFIHVLSWVVLFFLNFLQNRFESIVHARTPQPEKYLIRWEDFPEHYRRENLMNKLRVSILITGAVLLLVGIVFGLSDESSCSNRFEDYCGPFE